MGIREGACPCELITVHGKYRQSIPVSSKSYTRIHTSVSHPSRRNTKIRKLDEGKTNRKIFSASRNILGVFLPRIFRPNHVLDCGYRVSTSVRCSPKHMNCLRYNGHRHFVEWKVLWIEMTACFPITQFVLTMSRHQGEDTANFWLFSTNRFTTFIHLFLFCWHLAINVCLKHSSYWVANVTKQPAKIFWYHGKNFCAFSKLIWDDAGMIIFLFKRTQIIFSTLTVTCLGEWKLEPKFRLSIFMPPSF